MTIVSSFEIVAETLVPRRFKVSPNPYLIQGYFLQLSYASPTPGQSFGFDIGFIETSFFKQGGAAAAKALQAQVIDGAGNVSVYDDFFSGSGPAGFHNQTITSGQTMIFGVQVIPALAAEAIAAGSQDGIGWRGWVSISPSGGGSAFPKEPILASPTQRLVHYDSMAM